MRSLHAHIFALPTLALLAAIGTASAAEKRVFIVNNNPDGYGVDRCLASGAACGQAAAAAYCRTRQFAQASSFRKLDPDEITGAVPTSGPNACRGGACVEEYVAIECQR